METYKAYNANGDPVRVTIPLPEMPEIDNAAWDKYKIRYGQINKRLEVIRKLVNGHRDQVECEQECDWSHANDLAKVVADLGEIIEFLAEDEVQVDETPPELTALAAEHFDRLGGPL